LRNSDIAIYIEIICNVFIFEEMDMEKRKILIVDDEKNLRESLSYMMSVRGFEPILSSSGKQAIEMIVSETPSIAIVDLKLGDMSGLDVVKEIKKKTPATECILLTAYASKSSAIEAVNLGAYSYVQKPFDVDQLMLVIRRAIEKQDADKELRDSKEFSSSLLVNSPNPLFVINVDTSIRYVNPSFERLTGFNISELIGKKPPFPWWIKENIEEIIVEFKKAFYQGSQKAEEIFQKKHRERFWVEMSTIPIRRSGELKYLLINWVDITERKKHENQLSYLATHDLLTGLPNRMLFNDRLRIALAQAHRNKRKLAVMLCDLDRFKEVNDTLGHNVGDKLLIEIGKNLSVILKKGDTLSRMGGDEFLILLQEIKGEDEAIVTAEEIINNVNKKMVIEGHEINITTSIGIALYPDDGTDIDILIKNADIAMYSAKQKGRHKYHRYKEN